MYTVKILSKVAVNSRYAAVVSHYAADNSRYATFESRYAMLRFSDKFGRQTVSRNSTFEVEILLQSRNST